MTYEQEETLNLEAVRDRFIAASEALDFVRNALERYDAPDLAAAGVSLPSNGVRLAAPVPRPGKLVALGASDAGATISGTSSITSRVGSKIRSSS